MQMKNFLSVAPIIMLFGGFLLGATFIKFTAPKTDNAAFASKTVNVLINDGAHTRTWNGVTVTEGESVALILSRIANIEHLSISWTGNGRERELQSLMDKNNDLGAWHYYVNDSPAPTSIGKFYPKPGDAITLLYEAQ